MSQIIDSLAYVLGLLMDFFFKGLTTLGYPRLWACIVLFAVTTRFLFLPLRINDYKKKLLAPVVRRDLLKEDPHFFEKTKDRELTIKRAALKKATNKKYKLSNGSGCLTTLIQYPLLVALFYVVKEPQNFVPSLEGLFVTSPEVNTFLGTLLSDIPLDSFRDIGSAGLILCVPLIVMISNFSKMFPSLKMAKTVSQKIKVYSLCALFTVLLGWLSAKLPLAISLYWLTNDITYMIFDFFIRKFVPKNKRIAEIIKNYREAILKEKNEAAGTAEEVLSENKETDTVEPSDEGNHHEKNVL